MRLLIFSILFFLIAIAAKSQDTIWFLSGERLITSNYTLKTEDGMFTYMKGKKERKVGLEYVFSIHEKNGYEKVFYEPTSIDNTPFSVEQMRSFIKGEFEASEHYKATGACIAGFTAGVSGIYFFPLINAPVFWSPVLPTGTSAVIGSMNISDKNIIKKFPQYADDEYFKSGYSEIVKQKRISHSIVGGVIGLAVGIASALIINSK